MSKSKLDNQLIKLVEEKISPFTLNEKGKSSLVRVLNDYGYDLASECVDISFSNYIRYDNDGEVTKESIEVFLSKIGGIAYNKSLNPLESKIRHVINRVKNEYTYFNQVQARALINKYVKALRYQNYTDEMIIDDFDLELISMIAECKHWSEWKSRMELWEKNIYDWNNDKKSKEIEFTESILPNDLIDDTPSYISKICKQINSAFDNNLFDCTAVLMRRLVEVLLILSFHNVNLEMQILNKDTNNYVSLDKIIKKAENSKELMLSSNTKKDMGIYKTLGNFSAHKIWYNSTQSDIEKNILSFRALVEELMYKSNIKK